MSEPREAPISLRLPADERVWLDEYLPQTDLTRNAFFRAAVMHAIVHGLFKRPAEGEA